VIQAGIIGQIAVGIIYGVPLANILEHTWQETFLALGYVGLILIIFEGAWLAFLSWLLGSVNPDVIHSRRPWRSCGSPQTKLRIEHGRCSNWGLFSNWSIVPFALSWVWIWFVLL
jgi:hypothetical protein